MLSKSECEVFVLGDIDARDFRTGKAKVFVFLVFPRKNLRIRMLFYSHKT